MNPLIFQLLTNIVIVAETETAKIIILHIPLYK